MRQHQPDDLCEWQPDCLVPGSLYKQFPGQGRMVMMEALYMFKQEGNHAMVRRLETLDVTMSVADDAIFHMMREDMV